MDWLRRIASAIWPSPSGLEVEEPDATTVSTVPPYGRVVRALDALLGPGTVLYWEGRAGPMLAAWLNRLTIEPRPAISVGISPVADFYHLPVDRELLEGLAMRVDLPFGVEGRVRLHAYLGRRIVWQWRPAFSPSPMLISRTIPSWRVNEFRNRIE